MYRNSAYRIVDLCNIIKELYRKDYEESCYKSDEECPHRSDTVAGSRNGHKSCKRRVKCHGHIRFAIAYPCKYHGHNSSHCCCKVRIEHYKGCKLHIRICRHCNRRTAVKSEPAEPENEYAKSHCRQVMARNRSCFPVLIIFSDTGAEHCCSQTCDKTSYHMHAGRTCKIMEVQG